VYEMFDFTEFVNDVLPTTAALLPLVMAIVTYLGKLGVQGKLQLVSSLLTGLVLGGASMYFQIVPVTGVDWFATVLYGLVLGLSASGVYEVGKDLVEKL